MSAVVIVGAGGHAVVLADALLAAGDEVLGFTDADAALRGAERCGLRVLGGDEVLDSYERARVRLVNGIGGIGCVGDMLRRHVQQRLHAQGWRFAGVRHPSAVVSRFAHLHDDVQLLAGCIVQADARLAEGCVVNTAAVIEHDVVLEAYIHVAPRALLCGGVRVGEGSHVGAGAVVRQGLRLGARTVIGAGAVVVKDCEGGTTLVGVPAAVQERSA